MHKYFADMEYGGKAKALRAAMVYRDSPMSVASGPDYAIWRRDKMTESNTSGIVGVGRYAVKYRRKTRLLWQAAWGDVDGKRHCRRFFVSTHGERLAKKLACEARREATEELQQELIRRRTIYGA